MGTSMYTGVTGLLAQQRRLDVVGNNIANVNTMGYRGSRLLFKDMFAQTLQASGTNPEQVGLGVGVGSIDTDFNEGSLVSTGVASDLAVEGNGLFILSNGQNKFYTRDGSFSRNSAGVLVDPATGFHVNGYMADTKGVVNPNGALTDITIPVGNVGIVKATQNASFAGNLDSTATDGTTVQRTVRAYDSLGTPRDVQITFTKTAQVDDGGTLYNAWLWNANFNSTDVTNGVQGETGVLLFDENGGFHAEGSIATGGGGTFTARSGLPSQNQVSIPATAFTGAATVPTTPLEFKLDFAKVTDLANASDMTLTSQDGYTRGVLESFNIAGDGVINGVYTNGLTQVIGQVALANFGNVGGLARSGDSMFVETPASGLAQVGVPNSGGLGSVSGGVLEGSNVDLGTEFSNMIVTQRAYQASARTITASDTILQEAINLIR